MKAPQVVASCMLLLACSCSQGEQVESTPPKTTLQVVQGEAVGPALRGEWNFEGATPFQNLGELTPYVTVDTDPADPFNRVMKSTIPTGADRAEVSAGTSIMYITANSNSAATDKECWIGFRIRKVAQTQTSFVSLFQIGPVDNQTLYPGQGSKGLYQLSNYDASQWTLRTFASMYTPQPDLKETITPLNVGQWERFVLHCVFSSGSDGLMEIWKNDVKVYTRAGANAVAGSRTRVKWGAYIGVGNKAIEPITCYYDDIKFGGSTADYNTVAPKITELASSYDAYVSAGSTTTNYGSSPLLYVKNGGATNTATNITYLKFNLANLGFTPSAARLKLTTDASTEAGTVTAYECADNWSGSTVTWANRPAVGSALLSAAVPAGSPRVFSLDLSGYVASQYSGDKVVTIALQTTNNANLIFKGKESGSAQAPTLILTK